MSSLISLIEQYIQEKQLGHSSVDRDFSTLQETDNNELKNIHISAKKGKWLHLQREQQSPEIVILLDININLKLHMAKNIKNNPITDIIHSFSSDYSVSVYNCDINVSNNWSEVIWSYNVLTYESSIDRLITLARNFIECWSIPVIVSDFLILTTNVQNIVCIQVAIPTYSLHFHDYYRIETGPLQTDYLYVC